MHKMLLDLPDQLETERLILRPYRPGDGEAYFDVCVRNKDHLLPFEEGNPALAVSSLDDAEILVREFAASWIKREAFFLSGWDKSTGAWIVQIYIGAVDWNLPEFEIGYFVDCDHEGQGFVTEAVHAALELVFLTLGAHRARLGCNETNTRSWCVAERCGFVREGHIRQNRKHILREDGTLSGDYLYGMLRSEYFERFAPR